jgi:low affinity Fe/Cu permease
MNQKRKQIMRQSASSITKWIGSVTSVVLHTILFVVSFLLPYFGVITFDRMLSVVTNIVSLEAIYLSIFIQMSINLNNENIETLQEDIGEISENIEEILDDEEEDELIEELTSLYRKVESPKTKQIIQERIKELKKKKTSQEQTNI